MRIYATRQHPETLHKLADGRPFYFTGNIKINLVRHMARYISLEGKSVLAAARK